MQLRQFISNVINEVLNEQQPNNYKEIEFVCHNSDSETSSDRTSQLNLYNDLKKLRKETDYKVLPYMQDFSDGKHVELSLAVVILDKLKEKKLEQMIMQLANKHGIEFDLYGERNDKQIDGLIRGDLYDNMITEHLSESDTPKSNLNDKFWAWFGNSKVKEGGKPITLYHGSKNKFSSLDDRKKGSSTDDGIRGRGFYFSTNIKSAQSYGNNIYEVYLKIENPFDLLSFSSLDEIISLLNIDSSIIQERGRGTKYHSISVLAGFSGVFSGAIRDLGYDGIIHGQEFVCFNPNQIKSVDNDGSWDSSDNNIYS